MRTPVTDRLDAADRLLARIDTDLAAAGQERRRTLALVADNDWCRTALARRGIEVTDG